MNLCESECMMCGVELGLDEGVYDGTPESGFHFCSDECKAEFWFSEQESLELWPEGR